MESSSQKGRRTPRPWTPQDQLIAEVSAACGLSTFAIGKMLGRGHDHIRSKIDPTFYEQKKAANKKWYDLNKEKSCAAARKWHAQNRDRSLENKRKWHAANSSHSNALKRAYWLANKERMNMMQRQYYELHRAECRDRDRRWRLANVERHRENARKWRAANIERAKANMRRWRLRNLPRVKEELRKWHQNNRDKARELGRRRSALRRAGRLRALQPLTLNGRMQRLAIWSNHCAYCASRLSIEADHVLALKAGGLDEPSNIVPACRRCNASKSASPVEEWYRRQPFFTEPRWRKIQRHCPAAATGQLALAFGPTR